MNNTCKFCEEKQVMAFGDNVNGVDFIPTDQEGAVKIEACNTHTYGKRLEFEYAEYNITFNYCPWCGKKLETRVQSVP